MKKLLLALLTGLIIPGSTMVCMEHEAEHEESPAKRQKIEAPEEATTIEVRREIDTPAGTREIVVGYINLADTEGFTHATFQELIEEKAQQGKSAIFAMAKTYDDNGQAKERFYDAYYLLQHLFGSDYFTVKKNRYNSPLSGFKDIITRQPFIGDILFFAIDKNNTPLFLGTDYHLHVLPESAPGQMLINALNKNIEIEALQEFYAHSHNLFLEGQKEANIDFAKAKFFRPAVEKLNLILASEPPAPLKAKSQIIKGLILTKIDRDLDDARTLLEQGLEHGIDDIALQLEAQFTLAKMIEEGIGGNQDPAKVRTLYTQMMQYAEDHELRENLKLLLLEAQLKRARMLQLGEGGPSDPVTAREIYEQLSHYTINDVPPYLKDEIIEAKYHLARMLAESQEGESSLVRARALYEEIVPYAENEDIPATLRYQLAEARFYLAQMLQDGIGGKQDMARARSLYDQATDSVNLPFKIRAAYQLARLLEMDEEKNWNQIRDLYGFITEEGKGPWREERPKDIQHMALEMQYKLAQLEEQGIGGPEYLDEARDDYENVSKYAEDTTLPENLRLMAVEAQYKLALLEEGLGEPQNLQHAQELYQKVIALTQNIELPPNLDYLRQAAQEGSDRTLGSF